VSWALFNSLGISDTAWLKTLSTWGGNESYEKLSKFVTSLLVTNDCAERGVALIADYSKIVTKDEDRRQHHCKVLSCTEKVSPMPRRAL
jgi:hypothetical protein